MSIRTSRNAIAAIEAVIGVGAAVGAVFHRVPVDSASVIAIVCLSLAALTASWKRAPASV